MKYLIVVNVCFVLIAVLFGALLLSDALPFQLLLIVLIAGIALLVLLLGYMLLKDHELIDTLNKEYHKKK